MPVYVCLPRGQRRRIQKRLRKTNNRLEAVRCRILLLLPERWAVSLIAAVVGCARATVYRTLYRLEDWGEVGLQDLRPQRAPTKVTPEVRTTLLSYLDYSPRELGWQRASWTLELFALQLARDASCSISCPRSRRRPR